MLHRLIVVAALLAAFSPAQADFTFAHITDLHVTGDGDTYTRLKMKAPNWASSGEAGRWSAARQKMIDAVNNAHPDFVVVTGDLTDCGAGFEYTSLIQWMDGLKAPVYMLPGNHDTIAGGRLPDTAGTRGRSLLNYERVFGKSWYAFHHQNALFLALNSVIAAPDAPPPFKEQAARQADWLARELRYAANAGYPFVFVLQHYPLRMTPGTARTLSQASVSAMLFGHTHRFDALRTEGVLEVSGTSVKGVAARSVPSWGLVKVGTDRAQYRLFDTSGKLIFGPVPLERANTGQAYLWEMREELFPALPVSTHKSLLSQPY